MFIIVLGQHNKVVLCLTDTSLYIYICVKHFGMANIKNCFILLSNHTQRDDGRLDTYIVT